MINQKVVKQFLSRSMDNHDWLKAVRRPQLLKNLADARNLPGFETLWLHQLVCFLLVTEFKRFMLHLDMGGGKTLISLFTVLWRKHRGEQPKAIVFVPYVSSVDTWIEECRKHTPELTLVPLIGTTKENLRLLEENAADVYCICYASAVAMLSQQNPKGKGWTIDPKHTRRVFAQFNTIILDEIHKCSDINTLTYRMCRAISDRCSHAIGLSGTPFGKDPVDLWAQFYLVDFGETLGPTKGLFQEAFFNKKLNYFSGFPEYTFDKKKLPALKRMVKHNSIHYAAGEMHDLPSKRYIKHKLPLPTALQEYVSIAAAKFLSAVKAGKRDATQASYLQLRQLASGFLSIDGAGEKIKVAFDNNPKLDYLEEKVMEMPPTAKMVVFHHFVYTNQLISDRLKKLKIKHARVWSGQKDTMGELKRFRDDPACRVLVLNDQSGSSSLNLQHANYMFFFEQPDSPINRQQGEKRIHRAGQQLPCYYLDPFMEGTVDERIFYANQQGKKLLEEVLRGNLDGLAELSR